MIISNATPLIAFARISQVELLHEIVGELGIPEEVAREIAEYGAGKPGSSLIDQDWFHVYPNSDSSKVH